MKTVDRLRRGQGIFIVLEGIDGSGKSTQTKLLADYLSSQGRDVVKIDFPQHGEKSAGLVDEYLNGCYGTAQEVGPYRASIFYACDRYAASFKIRQWLEDEKIVIADRYLASNIGHQGGKISRPKEWLSYVKWLYQLEYGIFGIPKPDLTIILKSSPDYSMRLSDKIIDPEKQAKRTAYLNATKQDIHERDKQHLKKALQSFLRAAKQFPNDFKVINCIKSGILLPPAQINQQIIKVINKIIKL